MCDITERFCVFYLENNDRKPKCLCVAMISEVSCSIYSSPFTVLLAAHIGY